VMVEAKDPWVRSVSTVLQLAKVLARSMYMQKDLSANALLWIIIAMELLFRSLTRGIPQ
jgi:hypothetical protein